MSSFQSRLAKLDSKWQKAKKRERKSGPEVPDGIYAVTVTSCDVGESQSSNRLQVHFEYTVLEGEYEGQSIHVYEGVETEDNLYFLRLKIERMGYTLESIKDLEDLCQQIATDKPELRVRVKSKDEFLSVYITKKISDGDSEMPKSKVKKRRDEDEEIEDEDDEVEEDSSEEEEEETPKKRGPGRPKGSKNKPKPEKVKKSKKSKRDEDTEESVTQGDRVGFINKSGDEMEGKILSFEEDDTLALILGDDGKKYRKKVQSLSVLNDEDEEEDDEIEDDEEDIEEDEDSDDDESEEEESDDDEEEGDDDDDDDAPRAKRKVRKVKR